MGYERLNLKTGQVITEDVFAHLEDGIEGAANAVLMTPILYADLVALRDAGQLKAGMFYRITDYVTTTIQANTQSAGHAFDVIVMATDSQTLSEEARACLHEGDTYFTEAGANLAAWKVWYCLDNDAERFAWADAENGKGVIYRLIDEWNNDCPYDFKNILFKKEINGEETYIPTFADDLAGGSKDNKMMPCFKEGKAELSFNTMGESCLQNYFGFGASHNHLDEYVSYCSFGKNANHNTIFGDCHDISLGNEVCYCHFYNESQFVKVGDGSSYISCDDMIVFVDVGMNCSSIYFETSSENVSIVGGVKNLNFHISVNNCMVTKGNYEGIEPRITENVFIGLNSNGNLVAKNLFD